MGGDTGVPLLSVFPFNFFSLNNILGSSTSCSILLLVLFLYLFSVYVNAFYETSSFYQTQLVVNLCPWRVKVIVKKKTK